MTETLSTVDAALAACRDILIRMDPARLPEAGEALANAQQTLRSLPDEDRRRFARQIHDCGQLARRANQFWEWRLARVSSEQQGYHPTGLSAERSGERIMLQG